MRKTYFDVRLAAGIIFYAVFFGASLAVTIYVAQSEMEPADKLKGFLILAACLWLPSFVLYFLFCDKLVASITVSPKSVIWRCPLLPTVRMDPEDCLYVGFADFQKNNRGPLFGSAITYIYLSCEPFPEKYQHRINEKRCKKGFIKFAYNDKLCNHLIAVLPENQARLLKGYQSQLERYYISFGKSDRKKRNKRKK